MKEKSLGGRQDQLGGLAAVRVIFEGHAEAAMSAEVRGRFEIGLEERLGNNSAVGVSTAQSAMYEVVRLATRRDRLLPAAVAAN